MLGIWSEDETTSMWGKIGENLAGEKVSELGLEGRCVTDCLVNVYCKSICFLTFPSFPYKWVGTMQPFLTNGLKVKET